jgi:hypothetical protein
MECLEEGFLMINVDIYALDGCADTPATIELVNQTAKEMDLAITLSHIQLSTAEEAVRYKFPGSPTVRINGKDIEPVMRDAENFGLS